MYRIVAGYLQILLVVGCPFFCVDEAKCSEDGAPVLAGCGCANPQPSPLQHDPPLEDQDENDCCCHGAVMAHAAAGHAKIVWDWAASHSFLQTDAPNRLVLHTTLASGDAHVRFFHALAAGPNACALICAVLL